MKCQQPGCTGNIVDGYCDVCGMPGSGPTTSSSRQGFRPSTQSSGACSQPGCPGFIFDGYCDVCGAPQIEAPPAPVSSAPPAARTSAQLGASAFGSARITSFGDQRVHRRATKATHQATLGAGLTSVPPAPALDPARAVLPQPEVPLSARICSRCGAKVGQGSSSVAARSEGFCPTCGAPYSFTVKLSPGDVIAHQYEVVGALAHGGMGWIYLARDRNVSQRWVVLKGVVNAADPDALTAAVTEQRFLARVEHPLIVGIHNVVAHNDAVYTVMEYVGGRSLKQLLAQRKQSNHNRPDPLPVEQSLAFLIEILPALGYLHSLGLLYCDFKPDNVIQVGDSLKLIDLGGVRHAHDEDSPIYGTIGFQAPEVPTRGPSVASDIYTIGRTLLMLSADVPGFQSTHEFSIPSAEDLPAFAEQDSLYRLLLKCCAANPSDRFSSTDELGTQMLGVLREVVASRRKGVGSASAPSTVFEAPAPTDFDDPSGSLPTLRSDPTDPQTEFVNQVASLPPADRLRALESPPGWSAGVWLARGHAALEAGRPGGVDEAVAHLLDDDPWEWRALWLAGLGALALGDYRRAQSSFNAVYGQLPGELAPKLALAVACELGEVFDLADVLYRICASTDAAYVTASAFGIARIQRARDDLDGVVSALDMVPLTSRGYPESRRQVANAMIAGATDTATVEAAFASLATALFNEWDRATATALLLRRALFLSLRAMPIRRAGVLVEPAALLAELSQCYRTLSRLSPDHCEQVGYLDVANSLRPWSVL